MKLEEFISTQNFTKRMALGRRNMEGTELTEDEINYIKNEIKRIKADKSIFIFNDQDHIEGSTCYNFLDDIIYVTRNVFPDTKSLSIHPRDTMSACAVLAHEYYGHRSFRKEYLEDYKKDKNFHSLLYWQDECRASLKAVEITPGLTEIERKDLVMDAVYRAREAGCVLELSDFYKEIVYGYKF